VRETTAWVLQRAVSLHFDAIDAAVHFQPLLAATFAALDDEPRVAAQATTIVGNLATPCGPRAVAEDAPGAAGTPLSPFFESLVTKLLVLTDVPAWREWKLRVCAFEAINELISEGASEREGAFLMQLLHEVGRRLARACNAAPASADDRGNIESQLVQLTGLAQMLIMELDDQVTPLAPQLVALLLRVGDARHAVTAENAMRAIGAVADSVGAAFAPLLPAVLPRIHACIVNVGEPAVCAAGVWACGEVVRNSGEAVNAHVEAIVITLLDILKKAETSQGAKAAALAVFGDIASSLGPNVARYLQGMMVMLDKAARTAPAVRGRRARAFLTAMRAGGRVPRLFFSFSAPPPPRCPAPRRTTRTTTKFPSSPACARRWPRPGRASCRPFCPCPTRRPPSAAPWPRRPRSTSSSTCRTCCRSSARGCAT
jgi:importin subunit beta-1